MSKNVVNKCRRGFKYSVTFAPSAECHPYRDTLTTIVINTL